jgi:hypothetical protein
MRKKPAASRMVNNTNPHTNNPTTMRRINKPNPRKRERLKLTHMRHEKTPTHEQHEPQEETHATKSPQQKKPPHPTTPNFLKNLFKKPIKQE